VADNQTPNFPTRVTLDESADGETSDWVKALHEIEAAKPKPSAGPAPVLPEIDPDDETVRAMPPSVDRPLSKYEQLCKAPSMSMEKADMKVLMEFSDIIARVNTAGKALKELREKFPDALPPRIGQVLHDNMKETSTVMLRELQQMRNGRQQKKYEKKYICAQCHSVFMVPLTGEGICDECRASNTPRSSPY